MKTIESTYTDIIHDIVNDLYEEGFDTESIIAFLEDGEALAHYGLDDETQEAIECLHEEMRRTR